MKLEVLSGTLEKPSKMNFSSHEYKILYLGKKKQRYVHRT